MTLQGAHTSTSIEYRAWALRSGRKRLSIPGWTASTPCQPEATTKDCPATFRLPIWLWNWNLLGDLGGRKVRIGSTGFKLYPPLFGLGWNITEVTFTDHLFPHFPSPISCNWADKNKIAIWRGGTRTGLVGSHPTVSEAEGHPVPNPLPVFNENLPPAPIETSCSPRSRIECVLSL